MRPSQVRDIFSRTAVFYPVVAAAIIVPNLVLGVYGYWALSSQQAANETQLRAAYGAIIEHVNANIRAEIRQLERQIPTAFPEADSATAARQLAGFAESAAFVKDCFLVSMGASPRLVPPPAIRDLPTPLEGEWPANIEFSGAPDQAIERWQFFDGVVFEKLRDPLSRGPTGRHHPVWRAESPEPEIFYVIAAQLGSESAAVVAWLDLDTIRAHVVEPLFKRVLLEPQMHIELYESGVPSPENFLRLQPFDNAIAPHWLIGVRVDDIEQFRQTGKVGATIYMMLIAIFVPFVGVGTWIMVRSLTRDIREARKKNDFVSRVTHELKTPLTSIRMFIETLQLGGATSEDERRKCLEIIMAESERLSSLIDRILDLSKMESGNKVYNLREDDFEQVVRDTIDFFRKQAQRSGGVIRLYIERNLPRFLFDRDGVREILLNLLENAIKYSVGDKLVAIRVTRAKFRDTDAVQLQVIDNGVGIRRDDLPRIFDKFYRVDDTLTRGIDGSGLGLTVSREIARAHGGDISVESQHGRGSKFTLVIPIRLAHPA